MSSVINRDGNAMLYDFLIEQGSTLDLNFTYKTSAGVSMITESMSGRMSIKKKIAGEEIVSMTTENGRITLTPSTGAISWDLTATTTTAMSGWQSAVYDFEVIDGDGVVKRLLQGTVTLSLEVTT